MDCCDKWTDCIIRMKLEQEEFDKVSFIMSYTPCEMDFRGHVDLIANIVNYNQGVFKKYMQTRKSESSLIFNTEWKSSFSMYG